MTTLALRPPAGPATGKRGPAVGLGISVLAHAAVLAWLTQLPARRMQDDAPAVRLQIRLAPAHPARPAPPEARPAPAQAPAIHAAAPHPPAVRRHAPADASAPAHEPTPTPTRASETPALITAPSTSAPDAFAVPQPAADPAAGPVVDLAAARQAARAIAREDSRNLVALPARKPVVDPNADHHVEDPIEHARRGDCKTAYAGYGLLALIPLAKDALTGTGCKW